MITGTLYGAVGSKVLVSRGVHVSCSSQLVPLDWFGMDKTRTDTCGESSEVAYANANA